MSVNLRGAMPRERLFRRAFRDRGLLFRVLPVLILCLLLPALSAQAALYTYKYPAAQSKKGIFTAAGMEEDAAELGCVHATINLVLTDMIASSPEQNEDYSYAFSYGGETYWYRKNVVDGYERALTRLAQNRTIVTGILLLRLRQDKAYLVYPAARGYSDAAFYLWNMDSPEAVSEINAAVTFLARRYGRKNGPRIVGWIVGNEVNNARVWNWGGQIDFETYMDVYARACADICHVTRRVYRYARVYISLDHIWTGQGTTYWYAGKKVLDAFAGRMNALGYGNGKWCVAYHPYNQDLTQPDILVQSSEITDKENTRIITMKNLTVLTGYLRKHFSSKCRVILSEQGFSSVYRGQDVSYRQAYNVALAYYLADADPMVDSLILHRQVDNSGETDVGAAFGLWTSSGTETAENRKEAWLAYKTSGSNQKNEYTTYGKKKAQEVTGKKARNVYTLKSDSTYTLKTLKKERNLMGGFTSYGAVSSFTYDGEYTVRHDNARNRNVSWGIVRDKAFLTKTCKNLLLSLKVTGTSQGEAYLYVRLYSGNRHLFESRAVLTEGKTHLFRVDLSAWKYRKKITRVMLLIQPKGGGWKEEAAARFYEVGIG